MLQGKRIGELETITRLQVRQIHCCTRQIQAIGLGDDEGICNRDFITKLNKRGCSA